MNRVPPDSKAITLPMSYEQIRFYLVKYGIFKLHIISNVKKSLFKAHLAIILSWAQFMGPVVQGPVVPRLSFVGPVVQGPVDQGPVVQGPVARSPSFR